MPSTTFHVEIPGDPVAKGRPRFARIGRKAVRAFTPAKTKAYEAKVGLLAMSKRTGTILQGPVSVSIVAVFKRPQRLMRKKDLDGLLWHQSKPDLDNVVKAVLDGLNGVIYVDDKQVVKIAATSYYSEKNNQPRTIITVTEEPETPNQTRQNDEDMAPGPAWACAPSSSREMD